MKLTQDNKTLFQTLSEMFTRTDGQKISRRSLGDSAKLLAERNAQGEVVRIVLAHYRPGAIFPVASISKFNDQSLLPEIGFKAEINTLNKILPLVGLYARSRKGRIVLQDARGVQTELRNNVGIDLTRPHGSAIY